MALWKRGKGEIWYYSFKFAGREYQASSYSKSKTRAKAALEARRRELENGINGIARQERVLPFLAAAERWLDSKVSAAESTRAVYSYSVKKPLNAAFGSRLVCDITARDIAIYQRKRLQQVSARTVNIEVAVLRQVLKAYKQWRNIQDDVHFLTVRGGPGKAISYEDEEKIIEAIGQGQSQSLLALFVLTIDSGLRADEVRNLRHQDLNLNWREGAIESGWLTVSKSKTDAGQGRTVPLTRRTCAVLTLWLSRFSEDCVADELHKGKKADKFSSGIAHSTHLPSIESCTPSADTYLFPSGDWRTAWRACCDRAKLKYRWHDLRHTFITRLLENPSVSEQTVMALAGHVSKQMMARYSHIRAAAKQAAIATLERPDLAEGACRVSLQATDEEKLDAPKLLN